ncbi:MAG: hypothetical protein J1F14_05205 [Treponema sp.]|nr:hypothetical protein [Treponema sp.]
MNFKKFILFTLTLGFACAALCSCSKKNDASQSVNSNENLRISIHASDVEITSAKPRWSADDGLVCVLFGYGFNDESFYSGVIQALRDEFGLSDAEGLVWPVIYPADVRGRIMNLYDLVNERNVRGIITLGAPENTHYMLARLQDDWEGIGRYRFFSFFPQDDILGQEATCDFVLEYERGVTDEASDGETEQHIDDDTAELLLRAVRYMAELPAPLPSDNDLQIHVQTMAGNRGVRRYVDNETGIQSRNHFVMEQQLVKN